MRKSRITGLLCLVAVVLVSLSGFALADNQKSAVVEKININTASVDELMQLKGIGRAYASRIVEYRKTNGLFSHIEEIKNVKGIGERIFEKNRNRITVEAETSKLTDR